MIRNGFTLGLVLIVAEVAHAQTEEELAQLADLLAEVEETGDIDGLLDDETIAEAIGDVEAASDPVDEVAGDAEVDLTDLPDDAIDNLPTEEELADLIGDPDDLDFDDLDLGDLDLGDLDVSDPPNVVLPPEPEYCPYEDE